MQRDGGHKFPDFNANWPACMCCGDLGLHNIEGIWKFCGCPAGRAKQIEKPNAAAIANTEQEELEKVCSK